ncbi:HAD family phosphatase [Candidatus Saccharibacteria bacterium]|nr:MAG: HAD family phosphatase [Candidatus Saccharibacteria bacterium]
MSNQYKLLLLDIDGTLVASKPNALPTKRVVQTVKAAQSFGVHVAVVTGRAIYFARDVVDSLGLVGPSVFNGGPVVIDLPSGRVIHRQTISVPRLQELVELALPFDTRYTLTLTSIQPK